MGIDHHLILKMPDVLDREVIVNGRSRELLWKLALQDVFDEGESETLVAESVGLFLQLGFYDPFPDQLVKDSKVGRSTIFGLAF